MESKLLDRLFIRMDEYSDDVIGFQKILVSIPAIGPENQGQGELDKSLKIISFLKDLGVIEITEIHSPDERVVCGYRPNIIARMQGQNHDRTLWIMSHMDVVPPGERKLWKTDPFTIHIADNKIYGRGTEDNHQGIVSSLLVVKAFHDENILPACDIGLLFVADEESASEHGIRYVIRKNPGLFRTSDWIIIPDAGNHDGTMIEVAEKSILWIKCEIHGRQTHGSTPERGINAHAAGAHFLVQMEQLNRVFNHSDPLYDPPVSTFSPTKKEQNVENINTIPGHDVIYFDCRILPEYSLELVKNTIRSYADDLEKSMGVKIDLTFVQDLAAPPPTPAGTPVAKVLQKAVMKIFNRKAVPMGIGGGTVAAIFRESGLPAVCWCTVDDTLHGPDEYCRIENVINDAKVFAYVAMQS